MKEKQILSPFRDGKQAHWCSSICKINNFIKYLNENKPIVGGNWNPAEYVNHSHFNDFVKYIRENCPECLNPDDEDNVLYASMGTTFEDPELQKNSVDIYDVVDDWIENFAGHCVGGSRIKASAFGRIGIGSKFWADYYYKRGGILVKGVGDKPGSRKMNFALFFPSSVWRSMGIASQDLVEDDSEYEEFEI